jgi:hypothetical protein
MMSIIRMDIKSSTMNIFYIIMLYRVIFPLKVCILWIEDPVLEVNNNIIIHVISNFGGLSYNF